jgi:predicted TIM-barrel fold metal-dependent hydrolase
VNDDHESRQRRRARERAETKSAGYDWPRVSAIHAEHGGYEMDVHGVQASNGHIVLVAFLGKDTTKQVDLVERISRDMNFPIVALSAADMTEDVTTRLVAHFHANPDVHVALLEVMRAVTR